MSKAMLSCVRDLCVIACCVLVGWHYLGRAFEQGVVRGMVETNTSLIEENSDQIGANTDLIERNLELIERGDR